MIDLLVIQKSFPELKEIKSLSDSSGQKFVYTAKNDTTTVVLKILKKFHPNNDNVQRFDREIEASSKLSRLCLEYVPKVHDCGERLVGGQSAFYLIEEFIAGCTYRNKLRAKRVQSFTEVLRLADVLLNACVDFEKVKLVHRDIKPENIMIDDGGKIWIIDFGLVRHLDMVSLTQTGGSQFPCTLGYAPPEQMRNRKEDIDSRTDLFSVGIVLYESLNGSNPHREGMTNPLEIIKHVESTELPALTIPQDPSGEFSSFISSLTNRYLSRRPQTALEALSWFSDLHKRFILH